MVEIDEDFKFALRKLKKFNGKCFSNNYNIFYFNFLVNAGEQLFNRSKSNLKSLLVSANINKLVADNIATSIFKEAGLLFFRLL